MKDIYGKQVNNGDIMVEGDNYGEVALFFKVENNKPILKARWGIGVLDKYDEGVIRELNEKMNIAVDEGRAPDFFKGHYKIVADRLSNIKTEDLILVEGINVEIVNKFIDEGHDAIDYGSRFPEEKPIALFPDITILGGY